MKEFTEFRTELNEGIEDLVEHVTMPPNILILRRKTVRQFPDGVMVALYYNDKLGLQFSIPYGPTQNPVVTPVGLEEKTAPMGIPDYKAPMGIDKNKAPMGIPTRTKWHYGKQPQVLDLQNLDEISIPAANRAYNERQRRGEEALKKSDYKTATGHFTKAVKTVHLRAKKHATVDAGGVVKEDDEYLSHSTSRGGRAAQKSSWMANFEKHVVKTNPAHSGKIDWNDAHHHHKQGTSPESAAKKYTDSNPTPHKSHFHRESEELNEGAADDKRQEQQKTLWAKRQKRWGAWKAAQKPVVKESEQVEEGFGSFPVLKAKTKDQRRAIWMSDFEDHVTKQEPRHAGKIEWDTAHHLHNTGHKPVDAARRYVNSKSTSLPSKHDPEGIEKNAWGKLHESHDPIAILRGIRDGHASEHVKHHDGTKTRVDHVTAHALLTVHDSLSPENQAKMSDAIAHSKPKFHKMVDFAWKQVK